MPKKNEYKSKHKELREVWVYSFDCKKCGNEYSITTPYALKQCPKCKKDYSLQVQLKKDSLRKNPPKPPIDLKPLIDYVMNNKSKIDFKLFVFDCYFYRSDLDLNNPNYLYDEFMSCDWYDYYIDPALISLDDFIPLLNGVTQKQKENFYITFAHYIPNTSWVFINRLLGCKSCAQSRAESYFWKFKRPDTLNYLIFPYKFKKAQNEK